MELDNTDKSILKRSTVLVMGLIVFKIATKLTSETCTASALILALTCTSTFGRHVNVDVDVAVHVVDFHVLGRRQSWCSLAHCRLALAPASISTA